MATVSFRSAVSSASRSLPLARSATVLPQRHYASPSTSSKPSKSAKGAKAAPVLAPSLEEWELPEIHLGPDHINRYRNHYDETLTSDLLYMTYDHRLARKKSTPAPAPAPVDPYTANLSPKQENRRPKARAITHATLPELESVIIHTMVKEAIGNKQHLLNAIMALRAISGEAPGGGGRPGEGVQVVKARVGAAQWKLREGMPIAAKVELKGEAMYAFLQSLVDFVLPRLREYPGVPIRPFQGTHLKSHMLGPVVGFGLPSIAMGLFPQIEGNIDMYPRLHGFHLTFKTNQKGEHAQMHARTLLSGFRVPFYRQ